MSLALKLAKLRKQTGESLQDVAEVVGVTKTHIWQMERGKADNPTVAVIKALADHFGVTSAWLLDEGDEPSQKDKQLAILFRLAKDLDESERKILTEMAASLANHRTRGGSR